MPKPKLTAFISYVHEDGGISDALNNTLRNAFGEQISVFVDKVSIQQGTNIRDTITDNLTKSDILIIVSTGTERPSHDWAGFELGWFNASHQMNDKNAGIWESRPLWGNVATFCSRGSAPRSEEHRKYIQLDVDADLMEKTEQQFADDLSVTDDDPIMLWFAELLLAVTGERLNDMQAKRDSYRRIIADFKRKVFAEFKLRPKKLFKPQKQLIVQYDSAEALVAPRLLSESASITLCGGASSVFGIPATTDGRLMKWTQFCDYLAAQSLSQFWTGALVRVLLHAASGAEIDIDRGELVSSFDQRKLYRLILTTSTTYFNNMVAASIYMVEVYRRKDFGNPVTSLLVKGLQLVTRFRFLFLERQSEFHHLNIQLRKEPDLSQTASRIVTELDILNSDTFEANLQDPASWTGILSENQITSMSSIWGPLKEQLMANCASAISATDPNAIESAKLELAATLKKIKTQIGPLNSEVLEAIAIKLLAVAKGTSGESENNDRENVH